MYQYEATITNVVDGDTFDVDIDLGFHMHLHERIRLLDIDTPESKTKDQDEKKLGLACKKFAWDMFINRVVIIQTVKTDSFGRWLAYVWLDEGANIVTYYNSLGINKKSASYAPDGMPERLAEESSTKKYLDDIINQ